MIRLLAHWFILFIFISPTISCDKGDWLGPAERAAREVMHGWDMWDTEMVRPYETPMPATPEGVVPSTGNRSFAKAYYEWKNLPPNHRKAKAAITYRRYCHHCHGVNGDGRIIVGESFSPRLPDLRSEIIQSKSDPTLFYKIHDGSDLMIPLRHTLTGVDIMFAIDHIRTLKNAPSKPYFKPRFTTPIDTLGKKQIFLDADLFGK